MINIYKELNIDDFSKLIKALEMDDDIENSIIILQLMQINLEEEIKKENPKFEKDKKVDSPKKQLKEKLDIIIAGFLSKSSSVIGNKLSVDDFLNKELGFSILPSTKEERSKKATDIIREIVTVKCKKNKYNISSDRISKEKLIIELKDIQRKIELKMNILE